MFLLSLLEKNASQSDKELAASFIVTYGKTELEKEYTVSFFDENEEFTLKAKKLPSKDEISKYLI